MATNRLTVSDLQNPLFTHPSDGPLSISLSTKCKLGLVDGSVVRSTIDVAEASQWDTCNNLVISWIHNNISENIKSFVLFINNTHGIWKQPEKRFSLTNGSRKYKLNKDLFSLKQNNMKISDYFTTMSSLWEEIDSMNILPTVSVLTPEIAALLKAIDDMKEEAKLCHFLNGLDDAYGAQRSRLLMMSLLPSVEVACAAIQQEESQKEALQLGGLNDSESMAMFSKKYDGKVWSCTACGKKGHSVERCWETIGYPKWHFKHNPG
ncbi:uncharacterized protein LOC141714758 [Apium graveolens]|uniref:uncharacterized protein LOC141714758 n=1 Tax=Apium graveolens TaxID=4045 RepID=UPI003D7B15AA